MLLILFGFVTGCYSVKDTDKSNYDTAKVDFIAGCMKSGEFIKQQCACVYQDLQENYDKDFAKNAALLEDGSKEDLIFQKKLIESFKACNAF